ncbi:adenylate kinase 8 isoform 2-T2 [Spinachia spinachia]
MDDSVRPLRIPPHVAVYADQHAVSHLMQSMLSSVLIDQPEDPIRYLIRLLQRGSMDIPKVVVLASPAVGPHVLAEELSAELRAVHVTTESLLHDQSELSPTQELPTERTVGQIHQRLKEIDCFSRGWVLDGFPQTRLQALRLQQAGVLPEHVVMLEAPDDEMSERSQGEAYRRAFVWPPSDSRSQHLEEGRSQPQGQRLDEQHRFRCEVTGLCAAYQNFLKVINADQPHADVYQQALAFVRTRHRSRSPRILLFGPPGSGKSHQAALLSEKYKMVDVCCDQLLRSVAAEGSALGEEIQSYLDDERPVPDSLVLHVLADRLSQVDCCCRGWILHGFPCDMQQAKNLQESHPPNRVFFLEVADDVCLERITQIATDPITGERFHAVTRPALSSEVQKRLKVRREEQRLSVTQRLKQYRTHTAALQCVYPRAGAIDADKDPHSVFELLESRLTGD